MTNVLSGEYRSRNKIKWNYKENFDKTSDFTTVSTEMSMKWEGQHICESEKLQCKAIHAHKDAAENEGTNADSNIV